MEKDLVLRFVKGFVVSFQACDRGVGPVRPRRRPGGREAVNWVRTFVHTHTGVGGGAIEVSFIVYGYFRVSASGRGARRVIRRAHPQGRRHAQGGRGPAPAGAALWTGPISARRRLTTSSAGRGGRRPPPPRPRSARRAGGRGGPRRRVLVPRPRLVAGWDEAAAVPPDGADAPAGLQGEPGPRSTKPPVTTEARASSALLTRDRGGLGDEDSPVSPAIRGERPTETGDTPRAAEEAPVRARDVGFRWRRAWDPPPSFPRAHAPTQACLGRADVGAPEVEAPGRRRAVDALGAQVWPPGARTRPRVVGLACASWPERREPGQARERATPESWRLHHRRRRGEVEGPGGPPRRRPPTAQVPRQHTGPGRRNGRLGPEVAVIRHVGTIVALGVGGPAPLPPPRSAVPVLGPSLVLATVVWVLENVHRRGCVGRPSTGTPRDATSIGQMSPPSRSALRPQGRDYSPPSIFP